MRFGEIFIKILVNLESEQIHCEKLRRQLYPLEVPLKSYWRRENLELGLKGRHNSEKVRPWLERG